MTDDLTTGQRAADWVARVVGSWRFIIGQSALLVIWAWLNVVGWMHHWDPYPFILMNLVLSLQAAFTAPMILMSQNRQAEEDRKVEHADYETDVQAETEIETLLKRMDAQDEMLAAIMDSLNESERAA